MGPLGQAGRSFPTDYPPPTLSFLCNSFVRYSVSSDDLRRPQCLDFFASRLLVGFSRWKVPERSEYPTPSLMVHPIGSNNWRLIHVGNVELSFRGAFSGRVDSEACGGNARLLLPSAIQPSPQTCKLRPARQRSLQKRHTQPPLQTAHWPSIIIKCLLIQWLSKMFPNSENIRTGISFFFFFS